MVGQRISFPLPLARRALSSFFLFFFFSVFAFFPLRELPRDFQESGRLAFHATNDVFVFPR